MQDAEFKTRLDTLCGVVLTLLCSKVSVCRETDHRGCVMKIKQEEILRMWADHTNKVRGLKAEDIS
jgi:hypothetical protein